MRKKVLYFAKQMDIELDHNQGKGSVFQWKGISDKFIEIEYHKSKLYLAVKAKNKRAIREYLADLGNILMAIGDEFELYDNEPVDDGIAIEMKMKLFNKVKVEDQIIKNKGI